MSWLTFAISLVKLLTTLSTFLRERELIQKGRDDANSQALVKALDDLAKANGVILEFREKGEADVERTLEDKGWYRAD